MDGEEEDAYGGPEGRPRVDVLIAGIEEGARTEGVRGGYVEGAYISVKSIWGGEEVREEGVDRELVGGTEVVGP